MANRLISIDTTRAEGLRLPEEVRDEIQHLAGSGSDLGTPVSGTLTNCTGLPVAGIVGSTATALGVGSLEVGHAGDTTLTRVSAGVLAVEGVPLADAYGTEARYALAVGEANLPRRMAVGSAATGSGNLRLAFFQAQVTQPITVIETSCLVAGTSATLQRIGIFSVGGSGNLTLIASTASDTATLWVAASTDYTKTLSATWSKVRGQWYAYGFLYVGGGTAPTLVGGAVGTAGQAAKAPRLTALVSGQTNLPATVAAGSLTNTTQYAYAVAIP